MAINMQFTDFVTPVPADWLNNVNFVVNNQAGFGIVTSISSLRATTGGSNYFATGYYNSGDGGGGPYRADLTDTTSSDNGGTIIVAGNGTRWKLLPQGAYCWNQFGAKGDGTTDDTAAINAGLAAITGTFYGLALTYNVTALFTNNSSITLKGSGKGATTLQCTSATSDVICFGDGTANPGDITVSDLRITSNIVKTSGAGIRFRNGHNCKISSIRMDANMFWGVQFDGGAQQFIYKMDDFEINSGSVGIIVGQDGTLVQDLFLNNGNVTGLTSAGILLLNVSGFQFDAIDVLLCQNAFVTNPGASKIVEFGFISKVICDTSQQNGYNIITTGGKVSDLTFSETWGCSNGTSNTSAALNNGVYINQGSGVIGTIIFDSHRGLNNQGSGFVMASCVDITINASQFTFNSQSAVNGRAGIEIGPNISNFTIMGSKSGLGTAFATNFQSFGIQVDSGTSTNYSIIGNDVTGNQSGGIEDGGTGTKNVYGNAGYLTSNAGVVTLPASATSVAVTHGLGPSLLQNEIMITPTVDILSGGATGNRFWISAVNSTTFTLSTGVASTAQLFFGWTARTSGA